MKRIAINGMGRMGRSILRRYLQCMDGDDNIADIDVIAVNDLASIDNVAYLLRYDSVHGKLPNPVQVEGDDLVYQNRRIRCLATPSPQDLPWRDLGVEVVIECTGHATARHDAAGHLSAGAHRVLIAAPSTDADFTLVMGVNDQDFDAGRHHIVSNASCTTNSLAPPLKILLHEFGIESVSVTTVHAYTATQSVVDRPAKKKHRGRAAALSIVPTTTGADLATVQVLPQLKDRICATALRVPVPDGSITDITALLERPTTARDLNAVFKTAAQGQLAGILDVTDEELVSADILGEPYSAIVHARSTQTTGRLAKIQVWYDNETGYASRCLDAVAALNM